MLEHPAVREAAVVASPDELRGNVVKAFVVVAEGYEPSDELAEELKGFVRERLSAYAYPRRVEFVPDLPKTLDRQDPPDRAAPGRGAALAPLTPWTRLTRGAVCATLVMFVTLLVGD